MALKAIVDYTTKKIFVNDGIMIEFNPSDLTKTAYDILEEHGYELGEFIYGDLHNTVIRVWESKTI